MFMTRRAILHELAQMQEQILRWVQEVHKCRTLQELLITHVALWNAGVRCPNFGPDPYGMYRTRDIATMKPQEVYLGGIFGLFTLTMPEWEEIRETHRKEYSVVMNQYRNNLLSNLHYMADLTVPAINVPLRRAYRNLIRMEGFSFGFKSRA